MNMGRFDTWGVTTVVTLEHHCLLVPLGPPLDGYTETAGSRAVAEINSSHHSPWCRQHEIGRAFFLSLVEDCGREKQMQLSHSFFAK